MQRERQAASSSGVEPSEARVHVGAPMGKHGIVGWAPGFHSHFLEG